MLGKYIIAFQCVNMPVSDTNQRLVVSNQNIGFKDTDSLLKISEKTELLVSSPKIHNSHKYVNTLGLFCMELEHNLKLKMTL